MAFSKNISKKIVAPALFFCLLQWSTVKPGDESCVSLDEWRKHIFTQIYKTNFWRSCETCSGPDSTLQSTTTLRLFLPIIIEALGIKSLIDAGCGDMNWIKETPLNIDYYIGVDIVTEIIEKNSELYASNWCMFKELDIVEDDLPRVDLIVCRDVFQYFSFDDIKKTILNFKKSQAKYLCVSTYPCIADNMTDTKTGSCRYINFQKAPFNFPEPIIAFHEFSVEKSSMRQKKIGVWRLTDIP